MLPCLQGFSHPHNEATFCPTQFVLHFPVCLWASHSYFKCMHIVFLLHFSCPTIMLYFRIIISLNAYTLSIMIWYQLTFGLHIPFLSTNPLSVCSAAQVCHPPPVVCCVAVRIFGGQNLEATVSCPPRASWQCYVPSHSFHTCDPEEEEDFLQGSTHSWPVTYEEAKRLYSGQGIHGLFSEIKICSQLFMHPVRLYTILFAFNSLLFTHCPQFLSLA